MEEGKPNPAERSWLRLAAGCAMLKICEQKGVGDQFTTEQYYTLSRLVTDPVIQVREHFLGKLHKGLSRGLPNKCLPLDFMGLFALAGLEADKRLRGLAKNFMVNNINKRREYMKSVMQGGGEKASAQLPHIMPDYMLVFAVPVLTHDLNFTSHTDIEYLKRIRLALWFVLEPLMTKNENYSFGFYQELIQKMKNHKDAFKGDDEAVNQKLWAVCDLAMGIITTRTTNFERKEFLSDVRWSLLDYLHARRTPLMFTFIRIPPMYFKAGDDPNQQNIKSYLPTELQHTAPKKAATPSAGAPMGPPLYTVSGQLAGRSRLDVSADAGEGSSGSSLMVEVEEEATSRRRGRSGGDEGPGGKREKL